MSFCTNCGSPLESGAKFCTECGTRVPAGADAGAIVTDTAAPAIGSSGYQGTDYVGQSVKANYFRGIEGVGGKLIFDAMGVTFHSHAFNIQVGDTRILYKDILRVEKKRTMGLVPNGMVIFTRDGKKHQFVLWNREAVIAFLQSRSY